MLQVTIGIPVKNSERTIASCLKSILNAELDKSSIEIIIVDGGSRDRTLEIVENMLQNDNIEYRIFHDKGRGVAYARQIIVNKANGNYIAWIDSDNIVSKDFFIKNLQVLNSLFHVGVTVPILEPIGFNRLIERLQVYYLKSIVLNSSAEVNTKHGIFLPPAMQGTMCRVKAIKDVGGFDTRFLAGEDIDLFLRMKKRGWRFFKVPAYVYYYVRGSWHDVFRQATWWGFGRYVLSLKYPEIHPLIRFTNPRTRKIAPIKYTIDALKATLRAIKTFKNLETLIIPLYYAYRRIGFFYGYRLAKAIFMSKIVKDKNDALNHGNNSNI